MAMVEDLVHRRVFLQYFCVYDAYRKMARKVEACLKEEPAECFLLPPVGNDDSIFGLVGRSALDEA